ncbi:MAG TPA: PAS domain S-box protein [Deltaproteobacteria bacterium]|nr:PAS domain S-box protein [Deltaproteobacteria bacterium]
MRRLRDTAPSLATGLLILWAGLFLWETFDVMGFLLPEGVARSPAVRAAIHGLFVCALAGPAFYLAGRILRKSPLQITVKDAYSQAFLKTSPSFFVAIDKDGRTLMMNDAMTAALGYDRDEVTGLDYLTAFVPEHERDGVSRVFTSIMAGGGPTVTENHVVTRNGERRLVQWHGRAFYRKGGELDFFIGAGIDITERKKAEDALAASERRYRLYAENMRDVLWVLDNDLRYAYISPSVEQLRGYTVQEAMDLPMDRVFTPESHRKLLKIISEIKTLMARGQSFDPRASLTLELEQYCKDGTVRWSEVIASLLRDDEGAHVGYLGITRDITERKRAQESLRLSEERYRTIFETTGNATVILREDTVISLANSEFEKLSGHPKQDVEGKRSWTEFIASEDKVRLLGYHHSRGIDPSAAPRNFEFRFITRWGSIKDVSATATIIPGTTMSVVSMVDITEQKLSEERLRLSREQLRQLHIHTQDLREQERARVAREIHDELGQVLTALKMDLSYLVRRLPEDQAKLQAKAASMIKSIDTSIEAVRRIIMDLRPGLLDHLGLVPAIEWQTGEFQKRTGIRGVLSFTPQEIVLEREVSTTVFRIFQEALTNIARHAQATAVDISLTDEGGLLTLRIHDNGVGITKNQIDNPRSFGLLGMRERALFCNGSFEIFTEAGGGTTVIVTIPRPGVGKIHDTGTGGG